MLDRVGDVQRVARPAQFLQRAIHQLAGRPDEGVALTVFLIARLLTDQHQRRAQRPFAPHGLGRVKTKRAFVAARGGLAQRLERV